VPAISRLLSEAGDYRIEPASAVATVLAYLAPYRPLMIMAVLVLLFVLMRQALAGWHGHGFMADMMAGYFLLFGALKAVNRKAFAAAYARYDALAMRSAAYAHTYPFVELMLGVAYLTMPASVVLNLITILLMAEKGWSVHRALQNGLVTQCACLGGLFSIPISWVTVAEDLMMVAMAAAMLQGA
jgi:hypothetical protein